MTLSGSVKMQAYKVFLFLKISVGLIFWDVPIMQDRVSLK